MVQQMGLGNGGFDLGEAGLELLFEDVEVAFRDMLGGQADVWRP